MPKIAVLSVGKNNRYGYPSNAVIERFKTKKILYIGQILMELSLYRLMEISYLLKKKGDKNYF